MKELNPQDEQKQRELSALERFVEERKSQIIPEQPGIVRATGPRRQYHLEIRNGILYQIEI